MKGTLKKVFEYLKDRERKDLAKQDQDFNRVFDCKCCNQRYVPYKGQRIFYKLCSKCFYKFDGQKMQARFDNLEGKETPRCEDVDEWIRDQKSKALIAQPM